jgi:hypothetical protein
VKKNDDLPSVTKTTVKNPRSGTAQFCQWLIIAFSVIGTALTLSWVLGYSRYGIDFTDEGYYLVWISNPFIYSVSTTQFGFIYHPLYQLLDGNIAALRQANILITFGLAWLLTNTFLKVIFSGNQFGRWQCLAVSSGFATASLIFLASWLPTPSYNTLALQGLLIAATGLLIAEAKPTLASVWGWVMIGVGGWLAFMAKPTTAAALGTCTAVYLLATRKLGFRLLLVSLSTSSGLLVISALVIDGSIIAFIERLKTGVEFGGYLGGGHTFTQIMRLDSFSLNGCEKILLVSLTATIFSSGYLLQSKSRVMVLGGSVLVAAFFALIFLVTSGATHRNFGTGIFKGLLIWSVPFATVLLGVCLYRFKAFSQITASQWLLALVFLAFPHLYAFGTNVNYWHTGSSAGLFWVLSGLVLLAPAARNSKLWIMLFPLTIVTQSLTVALLLMGFEAPYRQPQPLRQNNHPIEIGRPGSTLVLSESYGNYFAEAIESAKHSGLKTGTPVIDLSGQSPAVLYAWGATNIGRAWMIGGYPGSHRLAIETLKRIPCDDVAAAWLLAEPGGPRSISEEVLASFGADFSKHYEVVASWETAEGAGGYKEHRLQQLAKPIRLIADASRACKAARTDSR